jgi:H+/Cl- antiporter ClcA
MSRESVIFLLGFFIIVMPHLGVPAEWKFYFYLVAGVVCMLCGYTLRRSAYSRSIQESNGERHV